MFIFSVSLSFSLKPFLASLFFCFSFSVSLFSFFFSFVLLVFLCLVSFWFLVFVSFFLFLSSLLVFHERNNIKILNCKFCLHQYFLFCLVSCLFFVSSAFCLSLQFPDFKLCFLFDIKVFDFQTNNLKIKNGSKGGLQQNVFFINLCFGKCEKLSFFWGHFLAIFE